MATAPEPVEVPAAYGLTNRGWYRVKQGARGPLVRTPAGEPAVCLLREPAARYHRVMCRAEWVPVLVGEVI